MPQVNSWIQATRPKTLTAIAAPVLIATALAIAEQLGIAIADYHFMESEKGRSKLGQQSVQF